ncbi:MAG: LD-carboxypeptidase [Bacteroidales bacterium]|jgi:muramoyltetrapeptide carboxypeptidase|nr:LD-carboxypeptidase [Bacteroidales bacterium]
MITPPFLRQGDTVGLIAPAYHAEPFQWQPAVTLLRSWGLQVEPGDSLYLRERLFAGSDAQRLNDLTAMMRRPEIKAVLCARGGYGAGRLLPALDLCAPEFGVKWLAGYSDISVLLSYWNHTLHQQCIHGAMPIDLRGTLPERLPLSWEYLRNILFGQMPSYSLPPSPFNRTGETIAPVTGGNLSVLYSLNGTPYQCKTEGRILLIEDVNESLHHLDRMMNTLRLSGQLAGLKGLLAGGMTDMKDTHPSFGKTAYEIIREYTDMYDFPVVFDFPAGHDNDNYPIVMGAAMHLTVTGEKVTAVQLAEDNRQ